MPQQHVCQQYQQMNAENQLQQQENPHRHINDILPAMEIVHKTYSLQPDMALGWKPRMKIVGPVPLNFDNAFIDLIVQQLTTFGRKYPERVVYLGARPQSSYKMHQEIKHSYEFKYSYLYSANYSHLAAFFRKFHSNFQSKKTRLFKGLNPTINQEEEILFDSNYEGGNLDAAIKVGSNQYDLFMRIDSNTRGHTQWFNFTVKNNKKKKIKINICNFKKEKTLFTRGMKPYIFSKYMNQWKRIGWVQGGINVKFQKLPLRYDIILGQDYQKQAITYNCLQFQYTFEKDNDQVSFAYCPPYNYSTLLNYIQSINQNPKKSQYMKEIVLCQSLSGLTIPLLTITNFEVPEQRKKCILVAGRIHPGESNSSYMMEGFIEFLCGESRAAQQLRDETIIKIIPMMNPDGVVMGNFRTSLCGKDLNRVFKASIDMLFPEVKYLKELVLKLKEQFKNRLILFLDFHGHSVKKNVFIYGPEYGICQTNYYKTRILPKIISNRTQMFRYYSCLFRISYFKRTTARAVLLKNIPHCYTIEASNSSYYSPSERKDIDFTPQGWYEMGQVIGNSLFQYIELIEAERLMMIEKRKKLKETRIQKKKKQRGEDTNTKYTSQIQGKYNRNQTTVISKQLNKKFRMNSVNSFQNSTQILQQQLTQLPEATRKMIEEIKQIEDDKKKQQINQGHQSDKFSEGGSDSESGSDDLQEKILNKLHNNIVNALEEFEYKFTGKKISQQHHIKSRKQLTEKKTKVKQKQKQYKQIQVIACLRKKLLQIDKEPKVTNFKRVQAEHWPRIRENLMVKTSKIKGSEIKTFHNTQFSYLAFNKMLTSNYNNKYV